MTVSRALRGTAGVREKTRERVLGIADKLGYRPHPYISSLMSCVRSGRPLQYVANLAYLVSSQEDFERSSGHRRFFDGAFNRARKLGYQLEVYPFAEIGMNPRAFSNMLAARGIRGLLVGSLPQHSPIYDIEWERFASATVGYAMETPQLHSARTDHFAGMHLALQRLASAGYRRPGFHLLRIVDEWTSHLWTAAFVHAHVGAQRRMIPPLLTERLERRALREWIRAEEPDVVICKQIEIRQWLRRPRRSAPCPAFVHLDWTPAFSGIAGIDQNSTMIAQAAVDLVVEQLSHNEIGLPKTAKAVLVEGSWVAGSSI
jgi:DNA-binding LacI/PurR family transcriptional regulator